MFHYKNSRWILKKMRRKKSSNAEDLVEIAASLPWWVGVGLAIGSFAILQSMARASTSPLGALVGVVGYLIPFLFLIGAGVSAFRQQDATPRQQPIEEDSADKLPETTDPSPKPRPDKWSVELLRIIDWKRFEEVCAEYFRLCGFHATTQSHGPDGGVDIKLYALNDATKIVSIVQCKKWGKMIGPKALRELLGVMTATNVTRGVFVTSSTFNDEATRFASENRIHLLDGQEFLKGILGRPVADQNRLLQVATEGDYLTPSCPSCGSKLVDRENKKDNSHFWACPNYPKCRYTLRA